MQAEAYSPEVIARFWMKVKPGEQGCWLWQNATTAAGYGQADHRMGHHGLAHRIAYELLVGPIPEGLVIDHLCRVRHCVNPDHLEPVTNTENLLRGQSPSALNSRRTECPLGHLLSGANLYISPSGKRGCRMCRKVASTASKARSRDIGSGAVRGTVA